MEVGSGNRRGRLGAMIEVRLYANLAFSAAGKAKSGPGSASLAVQVEPRPGLTVREVLHEAGVRPEDVFVILINGVNAGLDSEVREGDRVGVFPPISGG